MKISDRAMDPLGMNRVSDRLTNEMLMGITSMTTRARYYSFYVWNVYNIGKKVDVTRYEQFRRAFYDRERAFMMACIAHQETTGNTDLDHSSILGSTKGQRVWRESGKTIKMTFPFLANRLGGYGYYYQASIGSLGLTEQENVKDVVTELGKQLALSFEKSVKDSEYFQNYIEKGSIPKDVLVDYGEKCCLCRLPRTTSELNLLREILFGMKKETVGNTLHERRRETLSLILYCIHQASKYSLDLESESFLNNVYFHQLLVDDNIVQLDFPTGFSDVLERWRMFRSHDYFSYACESFLSTFLVMLEIHSGLSFERFIEFVDNKNSINHLSTLLHRQLKGNNLKDINVSEIIKSITSLVFGTQVDIITAEVSEKFDSNCGLKSKLNEHHVVQKLEELFASDVFDPHGAVMSAFLLLLLLYLRFYHYWKKADKYWRWLGSCTLTDLSPFRLVYDLEQKMKGSLTVWGFLNWFIDSYVIQQAQEIYNEKALTGVFSRPISWFHKEDIMYVKDREYYPRHRNSRFSSCYTILKDLGLIEFAGQYAKLTKDGMSLLEMLGMEAH